MNYAKNKIKESEDSKLFYQNTDSTAVASHAEGIYIYDQSGKRYIDGSSGAMVVNIGHSNPAVLQAMQDQMQKATFLYRTHFQNEPAEIFAKKLVTQMPENMDSVFLVSGGSEAVESAIKLARQWTVDVGQPQRWKVISRFPSYHGSTLGALSVTGYLPLTDPFLPLMKQSPKISAPMAYLNDSQKSKHELGIEYANMLEEQILAEGPETVLAFIMEPIGGATTGGLVAPDSYYPRIREICDKYGVLLIHDEVMSGAGRTGQYLGGDHWNCKPDLIALSKGLGSGYAPLGALIAPSSMASTVLEAGGFMHGHTYAGNPLAAAAGNAVLDELISKNLMGNAETIGCYLLDGLHRLSESYEFIGDVRGKGFLTGVELVKDKETMEPFSPDLNLHARMVKIAYERGLILYSRRSRGGYEGDHFLVCPPLITNREQVDEILSILDDSLKKLSRDMKS